MENKVSGGFPRVLVVGGEPFNSRSATGITISNLFREWPTECIGQIYTANIEPDLSICSQNFRLSSKDLLPGWFRKLIDRKSLRRTVASSGKNIAGDNGGLTGKDVSGILGSRYLKLMAEFFSYRLPPDVLAFVSEFRPDVIYTTLGNIRIGRLAAYLSHRYSAPVVVHFMDDWLSTYSEHGRNVLTLLHRYVSANIANRLVLDAGVGMSIGELMAEEYTKKFSVPFHPFMNPVDIKKAVYPDVCDGQISESRSLFKLVYVGGLHLGRVEGVRELGKAVSIVRSKNIPVELNLYVPKSDREKYGGYFADIDGIFLHDSVAPNRVSEILSSYDMGVHIESFLHVHATYTRLSVSTKIPQYFAASLPILAYGPADIASCRYVSDQRCGVVVGDKDVGGLAKEVERLAQDSLLRNEMAERAFELAKSRHSIHVVREQFRSVLLGASERPRDYV